MEELVQEYWTVCNNFGIVILSKLQILYKFTKSSQKIKNFLKTEIFRLLFLGKMAECVQKPCSVSDKFEINTIFSTSYHL